jgi:hypothetical protein
VFSACNGDHTSALGSRVTISVDSGKGPSLAAGLAQTPPVIKTLAITISGPDMTTISDAVSIATPTTVELSFDVPSGTQRLFVVEAKDSGGATIYYGSTTADLDGTPKTLSIEMNHLPATVAITLTGLDSATGSHAVNNIVFTISAADMSSITRTVPFTPSQPVSESFSVPYGNQRTFSVEAQDSTGTAIYAGSTTTDLIEMSMTLTIDMKPLFFTGTRLIGTNQVENGLAIARDSKKNIIVAGLTYGDLSNPTASPTNSLDSDAFVMKADMSGDPVWIRQFGAAKSTMAYGVAVDKNDDSIIVTGSTGTNIFNTTNHHGHADCFISKFTTAGVHQWTVLIGGSDDDFGNAVAVDAAGNIYVTGQTYGTLTNNSSSGLQDVFVLKLDPLGNQLWLKQFGSTDTDSGEAIAVDAAGNVYVTGFTYGNMGGNTNAGSPDMFITKLTSGGAIVATSQLGSTDSDQASSIATDAAGLIYVAGTTYGNLDNKNNADPTGNSSDMFVVIYNSSLAKQSTWLAGTAQNDEAKAIAVDASGNVFVTGSTNGAFAGATNAGGYDSVVIKFKPTGTIDWTRQIGSAKDVEGNAIVLDNKGNALIVGTTGGDFDGVTSFGLSDTFLMCYDTNGVKQ